MRTGNQNSIVVVCKPRQHRFMAIEGFSKTDRMFLWACHYNRSLSHCDVQVFQLFAVMFKSLWPYYFTGSSGLHLRETVHCDSSKSCRLASAESYWHKFQRGNLMIGFLFNSSDAFFSFSLLDLVLCSASSTRQLR